MYIKELLQMRREERKLLHEAMKEVVKENLDTCVWAGIDKYKATAELSTVSAASTAFAVTFAILVYLGFCETVKVAKLLWRRF